MKTSTLGQKALLTIAGLSVAFMPFMGVKAAKTVQSVSEADQATASAYAKIDSETSDELKALAEQIAKAASAIADQVKQSEDFQKMVENIKTYASAYNLNNNSNTRKALQKAIVEFDQAVVVHIEYLVRKVNEAPYIATSEKTVITEKLNTVKAVYQKNMADAKKVDVTKTESGAVLKQLGIVITDYHMSVGMPVMNSTHVVLTDPLVKASTYAVKVTALALEQSANVVDIADTQDMINTSPVRAKATAGKYLADEAQARHQKALDEANVILHSNLSALSISGHYPAVQLGYTLQDLNNAQNFMTLKLSAIRR